MGKETKKSGLAPAAFASDPMAQIEALIKEAKRLKKNQDKINKPKKRFNQGGSNMGENTRAVSDQDRKRVEDLLSKLKKVDEPGPVDIKNLKKILSGSGKTISDQDRKKAESVIKKFEKGGNFSSKELIMKATQPKKPKKKLADVSKEDMIKAGFSSFGKESLRKYLNMKNKLGRKPRADDFRKTIKAKDKNPELKKSKSLVGIAGKQFTPKKTPRKTIKAKDKNPELEKKSLVGIAGKQFTPVKPKKELSIAAKQYTPKIKKMNKGGVFKGIF